MTSTEEAVVTAHDWVLGIAYSLLASMIGGASKLSIRKSWIMDTQIKQSLIAMAADTTTDTTTDTTIGSCYQGCYEYVANNNSSTNNNESVGNNNDIRNDNHNGNHRGGGGFENETNIISPLEVSLAPPSSSSSSNPISNNHSLQSHSLQDGYHLDNIITTTTNNNNHNPKNIFFHPTTATTTTTTKSWILYLCGMIGMSFLNPLCCVLAMNYANPSILAPFSGLTLVWVVSFSSTTLGEPAGWSQRVACGLIVMGEVLVAAFGDHTNGEEKSVEDVLSSYREPAFRAYLVFMTLFLLQLGIFIRTCPKHSLLRKVAWGSIGGSITGFQNFLKDGLTIIHATSRQSQLSNDSTSTTATSSSHLPIFVFFGMATAFLGLLFLASCMKRYDATYSAAMFVVSFILSASLMSAVHYRTLDHLAGWWNVVLYPIGLVTLFLGAFILVRPDVAEGWWARNGRLGRLRRRLCICGGGGGGGGCSRLAREEEEEDGPSFYSEVNASQGELRNATC